MRRLFLLVLVFVALAVGVVVCSTSHTLATDEQYSLVSYGLQDAVPGAVDTLSVITYNIGYLSGMTNNLPVERHESLFKENLSAAVNVVKGEAPGIMALQEVDFSSSRSLKWNQLDSLAERIGYPVAYRSVNWDIRYVPFPYWPISSHFGRVCSGQSILSAYPVSSEYTEVLAAREDRSSLFNLFYLDRLLQILDVTIGDRVVKVMNVHLEAFDQPTRLRQSLRVRQVYDSLATDWPVILMGDFNSEPPGGNTTEDAMDLIMKAKYIRSAVVPVHGQDFTFNTAEPSVMIDYILYNENHLRAVEAKVVREAGQISDHFPVLAKLIFVD